MSRIAVCGSIATDHLMRFPGRFAEQLISGSLDRVSLSFLVEDLVIRRGGVAANICYGMGRLGVRPLLIGAAGPDFGAHRDWLETHGVDCSMVRISETAYTARFLCTTDDDMCQIASFYPGAMRESAEVGLAGVLARADRLESVLICADDPETMLRRAADCRELGLPFVADPSQQLARMSRSDILSMIDGAEVLITNEYEYDLLRTRTSLSEEGLLDRVGLLVTTLGGNGVRLARPGDQRFTVPAVPLGDGHTGEPTGVGDGFRAGFFAGLAWGLPLRRSAQVGCLLATHVLESVGPQEYSLDRRTFLGRLATAYGSDAASEVDQVWAGGPAADRVRISPDSLPHRLLRAVFTGLVRLGSSHYGALPPAVDARLHAARSRRRRRPDLDGPG